MNVTFWGTRGSIATAGHETRGYGGNTACVEVTGRDGTRLVLDAGTGIRALGDAMPSGSQRIDILLTHLHMDHIQGLGFFGPLFASGNEVHVWGPPSASLDLRSRLARYLSPPLFPVRLRDLGPNVQLHDAPEEPTRIGGLEVTAATVIHPGPTVGYRIRDGATTVTYLPDHEPALGVADFPLACDWTSGHDLAADVDLLIHDVQYTTDERRDRVGWGHSSAEEAAAFTRQARAKRLACFHHDPSHDDAAVDRLVAATAALLPGIETFGAREGETVEV
jgi:phosphoribosyl 1,2-cyclic phosphodiesterase